MCGLSGAVNPTGAPPLDEPTLVAMRDALLHRGPDDADHWIGPGVALASRRLAILDLSRRGRMPMMSPTGRFRIVYNGEVYNFGELRAHLEARGHSFVSQSDTEVILRLFEIEGPAMLERLNGMFALAIWDSVERSLFLARDRLGVKPLYHATHRGRFLFASEQKALFAAGVPARFNPAAWEELLCFRYVAGEDTVYEGVKRLLPGHYLVWKDGAVKVRRWWSLAERARRAGAVPSGDPASWYRETFDSSVGLRRISDVPVGVLLSGGLDSSSVAASLALKAGRGVASFTVRFTEAGYDEGPLAGEVARLLGLEPHELTVGPDHLLDRLRRASYLNDEPLAHGNDLHILAIAEYAKPRVTVLLSGEGGDETLAGYVRYRPLRYPGWLRLARFTAPALAAFRLGSRIGKLAKFLRLGTPASLVLYNACDVFPADLERLGMRPEGELRHRRGVLQEASELYPADLVRQAMYSDQHTFLCSVLDRNDRMTMGASIECRVPFLDYRLVEGLAALPSHVLLGGRQGKPLLRRAMGDRLPASVLRHPKWGFGVPWSRYLREIPELRGLVRDLVRLEPLRNGPFDHARLGSVVDSFLAGDDSDQSLVRGLVMLAVWYDACLRGQPGLPGRG
jgi:asparagine synthase (glutamine-hydrolysing)